MKFIKEKRAITLISLIITIVVIVILSAVAINLTLSSDGIFNKAKYAAEQMKIASAKEKIELAILDYEASNRMVDLYSCLEKITGVELIESVNNPGNHDSLPYKIVVDGYEFQIDTDLKVTYESKANGEKPEITSFTKDNDDEEVTITVVAQTKDKKGISKINLFCNNTIVDYKDVTGKNIEEEFKVTNNGIYKVQVMGVNGRNTISEELTISSIVTMNGNITAGIVNGNTVTLTVHGESARTKIQKVEIYENDTLLTSKTKTYSEDKQEINEDIEIDNLPFAEEMDYYAIITGEYEETYQTNTVENIMNTTAIANETDLRKMVTIVNSGISGSGVTVNLIADIEGIENWEPIGYWNGNMEEDGITGSGPYFAGTFNGNNHTITINSLSTNTIYKSSGLFGLVIGGTLNDIKTQGNITVSTYSIVGGIVGVAQNSTINNCVNSINISETESTPNTCKGGIAGWVSNITVNQCGNEGTINFNSSNSVGGIVGNTTGGTITQCYNKSEIKGNYSVGGIVGCTIGGTISQCCNKAKVTGSSADVRRNCRV